jgi:hypothetical protein
MITNPVKTYYITIVTIITLMTGIFVVKNLATGFVIEELGIGHCTTERTCWHENAHQMDIDRGRISESQEYQLALGRFVSDNPAWNGWFEHNNWHELYAQMWENAGGKIENIPPELRKYYSGVE